MVQKTKIIGENVNLFPDFCDYYCKYSAFADPSAIGACRKDLAVWCKFLNKYNNKHNKCLAKGHTKGKN